ncbi:MAG: response regulator transcription factor [Niastella sp.]|nr:response regulator transcription factor [Niastella sp.]
MINTLIIDDELHCSDRLQHLLKTYCPQLHLLKVCEDIDTAENAIRTLHPQLVFLDIQLQQATAFDLLQRIGDVHFDIIFTTAYEKYAIQAFRYSAIDYLLKPIEHHLLQEAVSKLTSKISNEEWKQKLDILFQYWDHRQQPSRICLSTANGLFFFEVTDIIRCEADSNYTTIYSRETRPLTVAKPLKELEAMLPHTIFYRAHQSHLINLSHIKRYQKGIVHMSDDSKIEVATRRREDFQRALTDLS